MPYLTYGLVTYVAMLLKLPVYSSRKLMSSFGVTNSMKMIRIG